MCKEIVRSPEFCGKLTFPVSLKQPRPRDGTIQCFIKKDKSKMTYYLYLCLSPAVLAENGKFLLSARRSRRTTCTEYTISVDADNMYRSSCSYMGNLRSNFLGTKFVSMIPSPCIMAVPPFTHQGDQAVSPGRPSRRFYCKKVSLEVPSVSYSIAQVAYELNVLGTRGPRRMQCVMHSILVSALEAGGTDPGQPVTFPNEMVKEAVKVAELPADETIDVVIVPGKASSKEEGTKIQEELESKGKESTEE